MSKKFGAQDGPLIESLERSRVALMIEDENPALLRAVEYFAPDYFSLYVIDWVPDQNEDFYWVLVDLDRILELEIDRLTGGLSVESSQVIPVKSFLAKSPKILKRKLSLAQSLARSKLSE